MTLYEIIPLLLTGIFGIAAIYFSYREEQMRKIIRTQENKYLHRIYEKQVLKEIHDRTDYSLDIQRIAEVITSNVRKLVPYATVSYLLVKEKQILIKTHVEESVSHAFLDTVKTSMIASLSQMLNTAQLPPLEEQRSGVLLNDSNSAQPLSYFHIPLIVSDNVQGMITVASSQPKAYREEEMTTLFQLTQQAAHALSRLGDLLRSESERLLAVIASLSDGVLMIDINKKLTMWNDAAKKMLQLPTAQATFADLAAAFPSTLSFDTKISEALSQNKVVVERELRLGDKFVEMFISPVRISLPSAITPSHPTGNIIGVSVLLHDITIEKSLAQIKEDFTNMVVHELRAPLTAMKDAARLMTTHKDPISEEAREKLLTIIHDQSVKLLDQVGMLLDAAKLESGKFSIAKVLTDIPTLIQERIAFFIPEAQRHKITLTSDVSGNAWPQILLDPDRIGQVINNLVQNSMKFTPEGGTITVQARLNDTQLMISISDTGIGISKADQSKLFSKYTQASNNTYVNGYQFTRTNGNKGTGLGLFIAKGIVEAHGGTISVDSDLGQGTTITFSLPLLHAVQQPTLPPQQQHIPPSQVFGTTVN